MFHVKRLHMFMNIVHNVMNIFYCRYHSFSVLKI